MGLMIKLAEWIVPYIASLFPVYTTIVDDGGRRMRIDWDIPKNRQLNLRRRSIAIHVDQNIMNVMAAADATELNRIGEGFTRLIKRRLTEYDPLESKGIAFLIVIDDRVFD